MDYKSFKVEIKDKIAHVSFNRPDKANSLDMESWREMKVVFDQLGEEKEARVIILKGEGKHFCAGMDLQTLMSIQSNFANNCPAKQRDQIREFIKELQDTISSIEKCGKPVIAAIHNACIGGGINIVAACDIRYCTDDAYFSIKETDLGLVADIGVLQRLPNVLNPGVMAEIAFTGRTFKGEEAAQIGLVNASLESQDQMMAKVEELASEIASKSPLVTRGIKEMLLYKRDHPVGDALNYMAVWNAGMLISEDIMEAMQANMQKRKPVFKD